MAVNSLPVLAAAVLFGTYLCESCDRAWLWAVPSALAALVQLAPLPARTRLLYAVLPAVVGLNVAVHGVPATYSGPPHRVEIGGTVLDVEHGVAFGSRFSLKTSDGWMLEISSPDSPPQAGSHVGVRGRLEAFDEARNPGEPSLRALAADRNLYARLTRANVTTMALPDLTDSATWLPLARAWASRRVRERISEPQATVLAGALWGERSALPGELRAEFQETGTMHVLVTAGLHVGIVAGLCALVLRACGSGRISASLATIAVVWAYAELSGAHLPSLRAATMASFALLACATGRQALSWHALAAAALTIVLLWPWSVTSVSFALSFSCVAAIVLFAEPLAKQLERLRVPAIAAEAIALTLATQIGTWPLTAATFLIFAPYAPIANAFVVPLTGAALVGGIALLAATPFAALAAGIAASEGTLLDWITFIVHFVASLPGARIAASPPPAWEILLYDGAAVAAAMLLKGGRVRPAAGVLTAACALLVFAPQPRSRDLKITVLDVGQGDGIVVRTPQGHVLLIDTGGKLERGVAQADSSPAERVGERTVVPFLLRSGIRAIDTIVLTHPHGDHVGGCAPLLRAMPVAQVIDAGQAYGGFAYRDCLATAASQNVPIVAPPVGRHVNVDGVDLNFLAPAFPLLRDTGDDVNENSIVVMISYQGRRVLFMGDAGQDAEARLLSRGIDVRADILKVGHHGSAYASTPAFLAAVRPRIAIVSVGRDNTFGHPAPSTIETLQRAGARVYRTDRCGAVTVRNLQTLDTMLECAPDPQADDSPGKSNGR